MTTTLITGRTRASATRPRGSWPRRTTRCGLGAEILPAAGRPPRSSPHGWFNSTLPTTHQLPPRRRRSRRSTCWSTTRRCEERGDGNAVIGAVEDVTADLNRMTFDINVFGTVRVLYAFLPLLQRSAPSVVVNVSSGLGCLSVVSGMPAGIYPGVAYPASKEAINMITVQHAKTLPHLTSMRPTPVTRGPISMATPVRRPSRRAPRSSCGWRRSAPTPRPAACSTPRAARRGETSPD